MSFERARRLLLAVCLAIAGAPVLGASAAEPPWWHLVPAYIDEAQPPSDSTHRVYPWHAVQLSIPEGWVARGQVDWLPLKREPSLAFEIHSPDDRIGLEYLPVDTASWSDDPGTRGLLQSLGVQFQATAADYLRLNLLPRLRPGAHILSIAPLPKIIVDLNEEFAVANNRVRADAARARITYLRNGIPVEEWVQIAVEIRQQRNEQGSTPVDILTVIECDILRAPPGTVEHYGRILAATLGTLVESGPWKRMTTFDFWHGRHDDPFTIFSSSHFRDDSFWFAPPSDREFLSFAYRYAWSAPDTGEFVVTDSPDFDPNGNVGTQKWKRLEPRAP